MTASSPTDHPLQSAEHDRRIDYIELPATDVAATKRFYASAFGWEFTDYGPDYTSFEDGRLTGGFRSDAEAARPTREGVLVVIFADDLEAMQGIVTKAGGVMVKGIFEFPGGRRFHFLDPNGNELAVWSEK
jgi:predicted enzyme related to lactoylglutathione lyase